MKYGRLDCSNIVSYISIFSTSAFSISFQIVAAFCVEILLVVLFIKCLIHSWKKKEEDSEEDNEEEETDGKKRSRSNSDKYYNSNIKKLGRLRRYSGQVIYPKSPRAKAPKVRSLSIGVTPIQPKTKLTRRRGRKDSSTSPAARPSIQSSEMSDSRSLDLE